MIKNMYELVTPKILSSFMAENIVYGYVDKKGKRHDYDFNNMYKDYIVQTPEQLFKSRMGVCWDQTAFEAYIFENYIKLPFSLFYIEQKNKMSSTHTFLVFKRAGKYYYFENSYENIRGINEVKDEVEAINLVVECMRRDNPDDGVRVRKINSTPTGIGCMQFMDYCIDNGVNLDGVIVKRFDISKAKIYHASPIQGLKVIEPRISESFKHFGPMVFGSPSKSFAALFGIGLRDDNMNISTYGSEDLDKMKVVVTLLHDNLDITKPMSIYEIENNNFRALPNKSNYKEIISKDDCKVIKEYKIPNWYEYISQCKEIKLIILENDTLSESLNNFEHSNSFNDLHHLFSILPKQEQYLMSHRGEYYDSPNILYRRVYKKNNEIMGFIDVENYKDTKNMYNWVAVATNPKYRRKGLAKLMFKDAVKSLSNNPDIQKLNWGVSIDNKASNDLAIELGFKLIVSKPGEYNIYEMNLKNKVSESVIPDITLYHASIVKLSVIKPIGLDNGNKLQPAGWSTFCWRNYEAAKAWAIFRLIRDMRKEILSALNIDKKDLKFEWDVRVLKTITDKRVADYLYTNLINKKAYIYTIKSPLNKLGLGNTSTMDEYTIRHEVKPIKTETLTITKELLDEYLVILTDEEIDKYNVDFFNRKFDNSRGFIKSKFINFDYADDVSMNRYKQMAKDYKNGIIQAGDDLSSYFDDTNDKDDYEFDTDDVYINFDKWKNSDSGVLLITGLSGSGKSSLALKLSEQYKSDLVQLDNLDDDSDFSSTQFLSLFKKENPKYNEYFKNGWQSSKYSTEEVVKAFIMFCILYAEKNNIKVIIEGIVIFFTMAETNEDYEFIKDKSIIIKGSGVIGSTIRQIKRYISGGHKGNGIIQLIKHKRYLNDFRNKLMDLNEDLITKK